MLNINIYGNYKVHSKCEYSYISQEDSTPDDKVFRTHKMENIYLLNGDKVIELITGSLQDIYFSELVIKGNIITIEHFNYNSGESDTLIYEIKEVKECLE